MLTRRPYSSTDLSDDKWEILRPLVPEAKSPRWSTASSSNSGDTQHHLLLRGEGRVRLEATSPRFLAVADGLPLLQSLAHRWHVGAHPLYLAGANPSAGRSSSESERGHHRQPVGEDHRKRGARGYDRAKKVNGRKRHLLVDTRAGW